MYAGVWLAAALYNIAAGYGFPIAAAAFLVGAMLFCALTVAITEESADERERSSAGRGRLWLQTGAVLIFIAVAGYTALAFHGVITERQAHIPIRLITPPWALVLQAWVFGLWHLGLNIYTMNDDLLGGAALSILSHSVMGLVYGIVFYRTRNLVACSILHMVLNSF